MTPDPSEIEFTIDLYKELVLEKGTHEVKTMDEKLAVRVMVTDHNGPDPKRPVLALVSTPLEYPEVAFREEVMSFYPNGSMRKGPYQLILAPRSLGFVPFIDVNGRPVATGLSYPYKTVQEAIGAVPRTETILTIVELFIGQNEPEILPTNDSNSDAPTK